MCKVLNWNCSYFVAVCPFKLEHFKISAILLWLFCGHVWCLNTYANRFAGQTFANSMYLYIREISMEINTNVHRRQLDIISWGVRVPSADRSIIFWEICKYLHTQICVLVHLNIVLKLFVYRIAGNFQGRKLSRIINWDHFAEKTFAEC